LFANRHGDHAAAARLWDDVLALDKHAIASGNDDPQRPMEIAAIHAVRGESVAALDWMQRGYNAGWKNYRAIERDTFFAGLRSNARFRQIVSSMRIDTDAMRKRAIAASDSLIVWHQ
jgi:hypothetical protein